MPVLLTFFGDLNDFLPSARRATTVTHTLTRRTSIKDLIESFGVPHPEVAAMRVNGRAVDFQYPVQPDDHVDIYPADGAPHNGPLPPLRDPPPRPLRVVVDANLGRLARYLRLLGVDALYRNSYGDHEIARIAHEQQRAVLTRDRALLQHKIIAHGRFVRAARPREQVQEVLAYFHLRTELRPFTRCLRCNGLLEDVSKDAVLGQLKPHTWQNYDQFRRCRECGQAYWKGSHFRRLEVLCERLMSPPPAA